LKSIVDPDSVTLLGWRADNKKNKIKQELLHVAQFPFFNTSVGHFSLAQTICSPIKKRPSRSTVCIEISFQNNFEKGMLRAWSTK
jgi:hypothetical protein